MCRWHDCRRQLDSLGEIDTARQVAVSLLSRLLLLTGSSAFHLAMTRTCVGRSGHARVGLHAETTRRWLPPMNRDP